LFEHWIAERTGEGMMHRVVSIIGGLLFLTACSTAHPVLYPNAHMQSVGKEAATQDIEDCKKLAESAGAEEGSGKAGRVATGTVVGGGIGAAAGAVGGAISGSVGSGSMIGAATGAVWGLLTGLYHAFAGPSQPNQAYTNFVNRCLQEKGYEVTGWQ
jgi:Glycine-zipper domain